MGLFPGKAHGSKEKASILTSNSQKSFEPNILQNFQPIWMLWKPYFCLWLILMVPMHVRGCTRRHTYKHTFYLRAISKMYWEQFLPRKAVVTFRMTPALLTSPCWKCAGFMWREGEQSPFLMPQANVYHIHFSGKSQRMGKVCGKVNPINFSIEEWLNKLKKPQSYWFCSLNNMDNIWAQTHCLNSG